MTLAEYVSRTLKQKKLSAEEVAARSEGRIAANTVRKIARGETTHPSIPILQALAHGMGEDEDAVLGAAGVRFENPWPPKLLIETMARITGSPALTELVQALTKMSEKEIQKVLQSVKRK